MFRKVVGLAAFFLCLARVGAAPLEPLRIKGLWIVRESMVSRAEVEAALVFAKDSGFNHVFVQVRGRGDAYYRSLIVPRSPFIRGSQFDPLGYAVARGHELGLNIHAWVTTYLLWSARTPPATSSHIYHMHPEWLDVSASGLSQRDIDLAAPRDGSFEGIYLSPIHPEVNDYLQAVFTEIILNYAIDGLHLDYSRYYDLDYGYNDEGLMVFRARHDFDPRDITLPRSSANESAAAREASEKLAIWDDYRRQKVTELVTALHAIITISGRETLLTAAVKPNAQVARNKYYQDWAQWLQGGILDYALPMNYTTSRSAYLEVITGMSRSLPERLKNRVIMGVAVYNQDAASTAEKIHLARLYGFEAVCVFSYDAHKTNLARFDPIIEMLNR